MEIEDQIRAAKLSGDKIRQNIACILNNTTAVPFWYRNNGFNCLFCEKSYPQCYLLHNHYQNKHSTVELDENHPILKKFRQNNTFLRLNIVNLTCKICFQSFETLDGVTTHLKTDHGLNFDTKVTNNLIETFKLTDDSHTCHICKEEFSYFKILVIHMRKNHAIGDIVCKLCDKRFLRKPDYVAHKISEHGPGYNCADCGREFNSKVQLKAHINKDHNAFKIKCFECREEFQSPYKRRMHMIIAHTAASYPCNLCQKLFTCSSHRNIHLRKVHLNERKKKKMSDIKIVLR